MSKKQNKLRPVVTVSKCVKCKEPLRDFEAFRGDTCTKCLLKWQKI